jgi:hypothetical protein
VWEASEVTAKVASCGDRVTVSGLAEVAEVMTASSRNR